MPKPSSDTTRKAEHETIVCLGTGPSLCAEDVDRCRDRAAVIAINDAYQLAPWADVLYAPDAQWWQWHPDAVNFAGKKYGFSIEIRDVSPDITLLQRSGVDGIDDRPTHLRSGGHSGWQAINLARHLVGAGGTIVLLGYDMQATSRGTHHFFGEHPNGSHVPYERWLARYRDLPALLAARGISIVNATRTTAIEGIDRVTLTDVLP